VAEVYYNPIFMRYKKLVVAVTIIKRMCYNK
jgi:hypothetical protein